MKNKLTKEQQGIVDNLKSQFLKINESEDQEEGSLIDFSSFISYKNEKQKNLDYSRAVNKAAEEYRLQVMAADIIKLNKDLIKLNIAATLWRNKDYPPVGIELGPIGVPDARFDDKVAIRYISKSDYDQTIKHTLYHNELRLDINSQQMAGTIEEMCRSTIFKQRLKNMYERFNVK